MPVRPKRESPITVHAPPDLKKAIKEVASSEDRSASTWLLRLVESHPSVQIVLQKIHGDGRSQ